MEYSLNPYTVCEHGWSYCFGRPTHEFWSFSAGIDFERQIMVEKCTRISGGISIRFRRWRSKSWVCLGALE